MKIEQALTIKQTAEQVGVSVDTIRYYEKIGLLPRTERKITDIAFTGRQIFTRSSSSPV